MDTWQLEQTQRRFEASRVQRLRNERLIRERRFLSIDPSERVSQFWERRGVTASESKRIAT